MAVLELVMCFRDGDSKENLFNFLDSIVMQRNMNNNDFLITIMHMDYKGKPLGFLPRYKDLNIDVTDCAYSSVPRAYNQRIMKTNAQWIMFMEDGDMFPDVFSLSMIMNLFPTDEWDITWVARYEEFTHANKEKWVNVVNDIDESIHGKLFRVKFLLENRLFFSETLGHDEGIVFLTAAKSMTAYYRFSKIGTAFIPYLHVQKPMDIVPSASEIVYCRHEMNMATIGAVKQIGNGYLQSVMRAICDAFFFVHVEPRLECTDVIVNDAAELVRKNKEMLRQMKDQDIEVFLSDSNNEMLAICNNSYLRYNIEICFEMKGRSFRDWLSNGCRPLCNKPVTVRKRRAKPASSKRKVAVFTGTRNVYDCMETAAKSLMYHTKMDKVYFLIEDDRFPSELPNNVVCMNVSDQQWFDPKGPNFNSSWTYMCMMRAAFAKIFPDEQKVLSLDIDVIVNEDISSLWDIDLNGYVFAGVPEPERSEKVKGIYANFGVIMMNLNEIRRTGIDDKIIKSLNRDKWGCPEQDSFNHFCKGKIYPLPSEYNATRAGHITAETEVEKISHYAGIKYWKQFKPFKQYQEMSWKEVIGNG